MNCSEYVDMISDEIDGELAEARALSLMRHLVRCDACRNDYSELLSLSERVRTFTPQYPHQVPSQFTANVMALIENEISSSTKTFIERPAKENIFGELLEKIRSVHLPVPSLSWSFAASLILVVSLTFYYKGTDTNLSSGQMMTDAKVIKAKVLKQVSMTAANAESDLNYYVKKHANALRNKPASHAIRYGGPVVSYVTYESGALRKK